jgi:CRISPR-associated protein Csx3
MFFERDAAIRAGDSHGDIVFWPLLALGQYLIASGDASILDEPVAFYPQRGSRPGKRRAVWEHVLRALAVTRSARSPAPRSRPTATATGTTRCSRPTRRCASTCAAPGP